MSLLRIVLPAGAAMLMSACTRLAPAPAEASPVLPTPSVSAPPPFPAMPSPPPRTARPDFRVGGDLLARHDRIVAQAKAGGHEIAFIGDSITEGWAGAGKEAWERTWALRHAINCGIGGDRTQHVLGRLEHGLLDALGAPNNQIRHIVLLIGTNNSADDSADHIALGVKAITDALHERLPEARVTLMAVFPRGRWPNPLRDTIASLNTRLAQLAAMHPDYVRLLDINGLYLTPRGEIPRELMPDSLHLSAAGYQIWSEDLEAAAR